MKNLLHITISAILIGLVLAACVPLVPVTNTVGYPTVGPSPVGQTTAREAQVQSVQIQILQTNPLQINAVVRGNFTESCATLGQSQVQYASNTFRISVYAVSPTDRGCAQVTTPFETAIALDTSALSAGTYTVIANGVSAVFTLPVENATPNTATPNPTSTAAPTSSACADSAAFVADVTTPDNTVFAPNTPFTKTWKLKNTGSCTWSSDYLVYYISGTTMAQQRSRPISISPRRSCSQF